MRLIKYLLLIIMSSSCLAQKSELVNNSDLDLISEEHFDGCIHDSDYSALFDRKSRQEKVYFEYFPGTKSVIDCDGVYYYRYVSRSMKQPVYRDKEGMRYSKYFLFIILDGKIVSLLDMSKKSRKRLFDSKKHQLEEKFGPSKVQELRAEIIAGYKRFY